MLDRPISRRDAVTTVALGAIAVGAAASWPGAVAQGAVRRVLGPDSRRRVLRVAHLTDLHIQPEKRAQEGVVACLHHVQSGPDAPDLILTGGDLIMDSFATPAPRVESLWAMLTGTFRNECGKPVEHCLGNHDVFGWDKAKSKTKGDEARWGKGWAMEALGLASPYRSFDRAGWHFVILDSLWPDAKTGYIGRLDEAQRDWLEKDLKASRGKPTLVLSHIPILGTCMMEQGEGEAFVKCPHRRMHADGLALHRSFVGAGQVKLCLSGHVHLNDRVEMGVPGAPVDGPKVTYICDGAVCGSWWDGRKAQCDEGYGLIDLYDDGTFEHKYVAYGWKA